GFAIPALDANQDWTLVSNTVGGGVRTVVGTRALNTGDAADHVFTATATPLNLIYARRSGNLAIGYHGGDSCGTRLANLVLSNETFTAELVKIYPNPTQDYVTIDSKQTISEVYLADFTGKILQQVQLDKGRRCRIDLQAYPSGTYLLRYFVADKGWGSEKVVLIR
ncbi:MAG: T9SS type A sorting domain-containing protein, partial [Chitinophagaceae bacterium]